MVLDADAINSLAGNADMLFKGQGSCAPNSSLPGRWQASQKKETGKDKGKNELGEWNKMRRKHRKG